MGEGIRNAKIVSLLKKPGDAIALDDPLCEVETDKAVYPIESSFAGVMGEWKTKVGDTVEIGQELGTILTEEASFADQVHAAAKESPDDGAVATGADRSRSTPQHEFARPGVNDSGYNYCTGAFAYDYAQTQPRDSCEPANRCALGGNSKCA